MIYNGTNGNDTLTGTAGPDTFYPLFGADTVDGLGGSDTLFVDYSSYYYDPYAGASVPSMLISRINSSGGAFGGIVGLTFPGYTVSFSNIENLRVALDNLNGILVLNGAALAQGATVSLDGAGGNDRLEADLSALSAVNLTVGPGGTTASFGTIANFETFYLTLGAGADIISTGAGGDILNGGGGDDMLHGGTGQNQLRGDGGNDQLVVNLAVDIVDGGAGSDTLVLGWADATRSIFTENLVLGATGYSGRYYESNAFGFVERSAHFTAIERFVITAGGSADYITTGIGDDWVAGHGGDDMIDVGSGNDTADGGAGNDRLSADLGSVTGAVVLDLVTGSYSGPIGNFVNFEGLGTFKTGSGNDEIVTTALQMDETIDLGAGDDKATVRNGTDVVYGGAGSDLLVIDYSGETGSLVSEALQGFGWGNLADGYNGTLRSGAGRRLSFSGIERFDITATGAAMTTLETGGGNDRIVTGGGWDRIAPGGGDDYVDAGGGTQDLIDYSQRRTDREPGTVGVIVNLSTETYTIHSGHLLAGLTVAPNQAIDNMGGRDTILGIEYAEGGEQDDVLLGSAVQNNFYGWGGNDRIVGGAGFDYINAGDGVDLIDYSAETGTSGVVVNLNESLFVTAAGWPQSLGPGQALDSFGNMDTLLFVERITTGGYSDRVYGNNSDNLFTLGAGDDDALGFGGNDRLIGEGGNDELFGGAGNDRLEGGDDNDLLQGDAGNDVLEGGGGNDSLNGGTGDDMMTGGGGNDIYVVDSVADVVIENAGEGIDDVRVWLAQFSLVGLANIENLAAAGPVIARDFRGNSGNNIVSGGSASDVLRLYDGGDDVANGGAGNDNIFFIGTLTAADVVNGGDGSDTLVIQGPYGSLALSANVTQIENVSILGGNNVNFGEPGTNRYDYVLTTNDANFAAGVQARINGAALLEGEDFTFDGSAETDAKYVVYGGKGKDTLTGGLGNDIFFYAEERFASGDVVNGGSGYDGMFLRGNYTIDFTAPGYTGLFTSIENLTLTSATDERYARGGGTEFDYNLILSDAIVKPGEQLTISGTLLMASETMILDASQETDGLLRLFGGSAGDTLKGGGQNDLLYGGLGADVLAGNGGSDAFRYQDIAESNSGSMDQILDFTAGTDKIELDRIDANTLLGGDQGFSWIGSNAFSGTAGELRAYEQGGTWFVEGDVNGDSVADLVIALTLQGPTPLGAGDFVL